MRWPLKARCAWSSLRFLKVRRQTEQSLAAAVRPPAREGACERGSERGAEAPPPPLPPPPPPPAPPNEKPPFEKPPLEREAPPPPKGLLCCCCSGGTKGRAVCDRSVLLVIVLVFWLIIIVECGGWPLGCGGSFLSQVSGLEGEEETGIDRVSCPEVAAVGQIEGILRARVPEFLVSQAPPHERLARKRARC